MTGDAILTEQESVKVIEKAGYKVVSFEAGAKPGVVACLFRVGGLSPEGRTRLEKGLREDLKDAARVAIDSLGRATVLVKGDAAAARTALTASLERHGAAAEGLQIENWPQLEATYVVAASGMASPEAAQQVVDALTRVAKVKAVLVHQDTGTATLWLKEPCDALDKNVREALDAAGFPVTRVELKTD